MTSQRETDLRKEYVRQLCTQSNRVFRLELCVAEHLKEKGFLKDEVRSALNAVRIGELEMLTSMLNTAYKRPTNPAKGELPCSGSCC